MAYTFINVDHYGHIFIVNTNTTGQGHADGHFFMLRGTLMGAFYFKGHADGYIFNVRTDEHIFLRGTLMDTFCCAHQIAP